MDVKPTLNRAYIESNDDALKVIQCVLNGDLHSVSRRPYEIERSKLICSGNIFVFIEQKSGIKRWTDGISWSPSRVVGKFLVYKELFKAGSGPEDGKSKGAVQAAASDGMVKKEQQNSLSGSSLCRNSSDAGTAGTAGAAGAAGRSSGSYSYRSDGLIKKALSLRVRATRHEELSSDTVKFVGDSGANSPKSESEANYNGVADPGYNYSPYIDQETNAQSGDMSELGNKFFTIHIISYYTLDDIANGLLVTPSELKPLQAVVPSQRLLDSLEHTSIGNFKTMGTVKSKKKKKKNQRYSGGSNPGNSARSAPSSNSSSAVDLTLNANGNSTSNYHPTLLRSLVSSASSSSSASSVSSSPSNSTLKQERIHLNSLPQLPQMPQQHLMMHRNGPHFANAGTPYAPFASTHLRPLAQPAPPQVYPFNQQMFPQVPRQLPYQYSSGYHAETHAANGFSLAPSSASMMPMTPLSSQFANETQTSDPLQMQKQCQLPPLTVPHQQTRNFSLPLPVPTSQMHRFNVSPTSSVSYSSTGSANKPSVDNSGHYSTTPMGASAIAAPVSSDSNDATSTPFRISSVLSPSPSVPRLNAQNAATSTSQAQMPLPLPIVFSAGPTSNPAVNLKK